MNSKTRAIFWLIYLVITTILSTTARPLNQIEDSYKLQEEQMNRDFHTSETTPPNNEESDPSEIQKAVCTVTAGDVKASAEAVTTKTLKGVCGSVEMSLAFTNLENKLSKELQDIRKLLMLLLEQENLVNDESNNTENFSEPPPISPTTKTFIKLNRIPEEPKPIVNELNKHFNENPKLKSLQHKDIQPSNESLSTPVREHEISMFNNTLLTDKDFKVFTYYWRLENITSKIKNGSSISIESPMFSIKGKTFKIKAHFQHLHRDFLFLQLDDLSNSPQLSYGNSIILDTGGIFKKINSNSMKYKISILHQNKQRSKDLVSQEFHNHEKGFLIPNSALLDSPFIKDDAVLIQIFLYL